VIISTTIIAATATTATITIGTTQNKENGWMRNFLLYVMATCFGCTVLLSSRQI
jgi:hypothetical protein